MISKNMFPFENDHAAPFGGKDSADGRDLRPI
jgi:hypothetical protein